MKSCKISVKSLKPIDPCKQVRSYYEDYPILDCPKCGKTHHQPEYLNPKHPDFGVGFRCMTCMSFNELI